MASPFVSERAGTAAAAALDPRGARRREPALAARALTLGRAGETAPILGGVDLEIHPGDCVWLRGATGCGKTTLLRALAGLAGVEVRAGRIERPGRAALLLQHVETQLLCTTVAEEVALGPRSLALSDDLVAQRVAASLERVGLAGTGSRAVDTLSAGQKQRVVIAALLALAPRALLLDEPSTALDAPSLGALAAVLAELRRQGVAMIVADHAPGALAAACNRRLRIDGARVYEDDAGPRARTPRRIDRLSRRSAPASPGAAARCDETPGAGERWLVTGPNGSGKSTWLRTLAARGDRPLAARGVALVLQEPRRSLFARTVGEEIAFSLERRRVRAGEREARIRELLARFDLLACVDRSPLRLSFGQQHRVAIAAALAARPGLILLDEPFAGLDPTARSQLLELLEHEQAHTGASLVVASHDDAPLSDWCDRVVALPARDPRPRAAARPSEVRDG